MLTWPGLETRISQVTGWLFYWLYYYYDTANSVYIITQKIGLTVARTHNWQLAGSLYTSVTTTIFLCIVQNTTLYLQIFYHLKSEYKCIFIWCNSYLLYLILFIMSKVPHVWNYLLRKAPWVFRYISVSHGYVIFKIK